MLALQREAKRTARDRRGCKALLAAPSGEQHTVALQMIANLLRDAGYTVLMLGPTCRRARSPRPPSATSPR